MTYLLQVLWLMVEFRSVHQAALGTPGTPGTPIKHTRHTHQDTPGTPGTHIKPSVKNASTPGTRLTLCCVVPAASSTIIAVPYARSTSRLKSDVCRTHRVDQATHAICRRCGGICRENQKRNPAKMKQLAILQLSSPRFERCVYAPSNSISDYQGVWT